MVQLIRKEIPLSSITTVPFGAIIELLLCRYDVSPWNTKVVSALPSGQISSFGQDMPFAIQRSFVLPIVSEQIM
jgi:hypothetical protein